MWSLAYKYQRHIYENKESVTIFLSDLSANNCRLDWSSHFEMRLDFGSGKVLQISIQHIWVKEYKLNNLALSIFTMIHFSVFLSQLQ